MTSFQCIECERYRKDGRCKAFPDGIPEEIITGQFDHTKPHKGDNGIQFEPIKESAK